MALANLGKNKEATNCLKKSYSLDPENEETLSNIGTILLDMKNFAEALTYFEKEIKLDPTDEKAWYNKAASLSLMKRVDDALDALTVASSIDPENKILMEDDEDFKNIRKSDRFRKLLSN